MYFVAYNLQNYKGTDITLTKHSNVWINSLLRKWLRLACMVTNTLQVKSPAHILALFAHTVEFHIMQSVSAIRLSIG